MNNNSLQPPTFTTSFRLFLLSLIIIALITGLYMRVFQNQKANVITPDTDKMSIIQVKAGQNLKEILDTVGDSTEVIIAPSVFTFQETLYIKGKNRISLRTPKGERSIVQCSNGPVLILEDCSEISFENISFECKSPDNPTIKILHSAKIFMQMLQLEGTGEVLVADKECQEIKLKDSEVLGRVSISTTRGISLENNNFRVECNSAALEIVEGKKLFLSNNTIQSRAGVSLTKIQKADTPNVLSDNKIVALQYGLEIKESSNFFLHLNKIETEKQVAVSISVCNDIKIGTEGENSPTNQFKSKEQQALFISGCKDVRVYDCLLCSQASASEKFALQMEYSKNIKIEKNQISGFSEQKQPQNVVKGGGILLNNSSDILLEGNEISYSKDAGIIIKESEAKLVKNTIRYNASDGVLIENSKVEIVGGIISSNSIGITMKKIKPESRIEQNQITHNAKGIFLDDCPESAGLKITGNTISQNGNGLELKKSFVIFTGNKVNSNTGYGIFKIDSSSKVNPEKESGNEFTGNTQGKSNY